MSHLPKRLLLTELIHAQVINPMEVSVHATPRGEREDSSFKIELGQIKIQERVFIDRELYARPSDDEMSSMPCPIVELRERSPAISVFCSNHPKVTIAPIRVRCPMNRLMSIKVNRDVVDCSWLIVLVAASVKIPLSTATRAAVRVCIKHDMKRLSARPPALFQKIQRS